MISKTYIREIEVFAFADGASLLAAAALNKRMQNIAGRGFFKTIAAPARRKRDKLTVRRFIRRIASE